MRRYSAAGGLGLRWELACKQLDAAAGGLQSRRRHFILRISLPGAAAHLHLEPDPHVHVRHIACPPCRNQRTAYGHSEFHDLSSRRLAIPGFDGLHASTLHPSSPTSPSVTPSPHAQVHVSTHEDNAQDTFAHVNSYLLPQRTTVDAVVPSLARSNT